jgi:large subunit ribosomal protein L25
MSMTTTFTAFARQTQGTGASRRLRRTGRTPGIVYGGSNAATNVELDHNALWHALKKEDFHSSILTMTFEGAQSQVLLRDVQYHPFKAQVLHIDFQRVDPNAPIHMKVPFHFSGQENSPAVKIGKCLVSHIMTEIEVSCLPKDLPHFIAIDLSTLEPNASVHVSDIPVPVGVKLSVRGKVDPVVVAAIAPKVKDEDESSAAPSAADVPATAQKAPADGKAASAAKPAAKK